MISRCLSLALLTLGLALGIASPSYASCNYETHIVYVQGVAQVSEGMVCNNASPVVESSEEPPRDSELDGICVQTAISQGLDPFGFCGLAPDEVVNLLTPDVIATAFQQIPLPPSELKVQPANGRTLVNFATNFFTDNAPLDRTVTLLGQRVDLHIVPSGFGWRFGDGESLATDEAGAPYPDLRITHDYQRKGRVRPAVDTTYTATYRVNGGPWASVPGGVTIPGAPIGLEVLTATPVLVGS